MISGPAYLGTHITRPPTLSGPFGQAWSIMLQPIGQRGKPDFDAMISHTIISAPQSHPLWWIYALSIIHLRHIDGVKPAHVKFPGATHELMLLALNPEKPVPDIDAMEHGDFDSFHLLQPANLVEQFQVPSDAYAWYLGETAIKAIVDGIISPDTDYRSQWKHAIAETAKHLREGGHPEAVQ